MPIKLELPPVTELTNPRDLSDEACEQCFHCFMARELYRRLHAGDTLTQVIGDTLNAIAGVLSSLETREDRENAARDFPVLLAQLCVAANRNIDLANAPPDGDGH